jgi:hypothetical protein
MHNLNLPHESKDTRSSAMCLDEVVLRMIHTKTKSKLAQQGFGLIKNFPAIWALLHVDGLA